jgi:hypothetical protein
MLAALQQSRTEAQQLATESLQIAAGLGDARTEAWARTTLGHIEWLCDDAYAARNYLKRSLVMHEALGDRFGVTRSLLLLGTAMCIPDQLAGGRAYLDRGLLLATERARPVHDHSRSAGLRATPRRTVTWLR